ncbi:MAG: heavy-metal-associated domain-containing protein [Butyricimonas faecihominis]
MKTMKILFTLVVFVMMGLTVSAQAKKDTTVIFKVGIHCPSCKAKLDKDMPFEKGIKDYKLNMKDSTVLISFRTDKNSVEALRAAIERHDVKVVGMCDKDGKLMKCGKAHKCCKEGNKEACKGSCGEKKCDSKCDQNCESKESKCEGKCGDNCCSKTGKTDECCKNKKK